jgi:hypothetical protein
MEKGLMIVIMEDKKEKNAHVITSKEGKHYISNVKFKEERNGYHME